MPRPGASLPPSPRGTRFLGADPRAGLSRARRVGPEPAVEPGVAVLRGRGARGAARRDAVRGPRGRRRGPSGPVRLERRQRDRRRPRPRRVRRAVRHLLRRAPAQLLGRQDVRRAARLQALPLQGPVRRARRLLRVALLRRKRRRPTVRAPLRRDDAARGRRERPRLPRPRGRRAGGGAAGGRQDLLARLRREKIQRRDRPRPLGGPRRPLRAVPRPPRRAPRGGGGDAPVMMPLGAS